MQRCHGHIELGLFSVFQLQEFILLVIYGQRGEPTIAADAVIDVHNGSADVQLVQIADDLIRVNACPLVAVGVHAGTATVDVCLGDEGELVA